MVDLYISICNLSIHYYSVSVAKLCKCLYEGVCVHICAYAYHIYICMYVCRCRFINDNIYIYNVCCICSRHMITNRHNTAEVKGSSDACCIAAFATA